MAKKIARRTPMEKLIGFIRDERAHRDAFLSEPRRSKAIAEADEAEAIALSLFASRKHLTQTDPPAAGTYLVNIQRPDKSWEPDVCQWEPEGRKWTSTNQGIVVYWDPIAERDAEIAALRHQVETMIQAQAYAENTILRQRWMMDAQKRTASDAIAERDASIARMERQLSDNLAKAEMLRAQVAELQATVAAGETERKELHDLVIELQDNIAFNRTGRIP